MTRALLAFILVPLFGALVGVAGYYLFNRTKKAGPTLGEFLWEFVYATQRYCRDHPHWVGIATFVGGPIALLCNVPYKWHRLGERPSSIKRPGEIYLDFIWVAVILLTAIGMFLLLWLGFQFALTHHHSRWWNWVGFLGYAVILCITTFIAYTNFRDSEFESEMAHAASFPHAV